jgi:hypothetical protein
MPSNFDVFKMIQIRLMKEQEKNMLNQLQLRVNDLDAARALILQLKRSKNSGESSHI